MSVSPSNTTVLHFSQYSEADNSTEFCKMLNSKGLSKLSSNPNSFKLLTIQDIREESKIEWLFLLESLKTDKLFNILQKKTIAAITSLHKLNPQEQEELLKSEKNVAFYQDMRDQASKMVRRALVKHIEGAPVSVVVEMDDSKYIPKLSLLGTLKTLPPPTAASQKILRSMTPQQIHLASILQMPLLPITEEKKLWKQVDRSLLRKKQDQQKKENLDKLFGQINDNVKYFLFISSKLNIDLNDIPISELESEANIKAFAEFNERKRIQLERKKLLETKKEEPSQAVKTSKSKAKKKKKKQQCEKAKQEKVAKENQVTPLPTSSQVNALESAVPSIFSQIDCFLDKRITRWFQATVEGIKNFEDRVLTTKIFHYQNLSAEKIAEERIYHRLPGLDRLLSLTAEALGKYSRPYQFKHHGNVKTGRCFSAHLKHGSIEEKGMLYVGLDGKRIYHAKFVSFSKESSLVRDKPNDICIPLDGLDSQPSLVQEGEWQMQGGYTFTIDEDQTIVWSIADGNTPVEYQIQSLF